MARPLKQGVDYFPMDVHLDTKFKFIEIKHGLEGFGVVVKLMQTIYAQGYWTEWGEDEQLLFASENRIDFDKLEEIVSECLKRGIFNQDLYDKHKILTSKGIQKRYKEIVRRRKDVNVIADYLLIDSITVVNDDINSINDVNMNTSSRHGDDKSTQRKGKEIETEIKAKTSSTRKQVFEPDNDYYKLAEFMLSEIRKNNPSHKQPNLQTWSEDFRKLVEIDKREKREISRMIRWTQKDEFEMVNVLSPAKLRKRYDNLAMKMKRDEGELIGAGVSSGYKPYVHDLTQGED